MTREKFLAVAEPCIFLATSQLSRPETIIVDELLKTVRILTEALVVAATYMKE